MHRFLILFGFIFAIFAFADAGGEDGPPLISLDKTVSLASGRTDMVVLTPKPQNMRESVAVLCASALPSIAPDDIHDLNYFDVYVSIGGIEAFRSAGKIYPIGTVFLKRKYTESPVRPSSQRKSPLLKPTDLNLTPASTYHTELFTGMRKRETGYNPKGGDWEYFVTKADGSTVTDHGIMTSCMTCHAAYASHDYVTHDYEVKFRYLEANGSSGH